MRITITSSNLEHNSLSTNSQLTIKRLTKVVAIDAGNSAATVVKLRKKNIN